MKPGAARRAAPRAGAPPAAPPPRASWTRLAFALLFLAGLACRLDAFRGNHLENDEQVYRALVVEMDRGHGYTLAHAGIPPDVLPPAMYGRPLFYHHPPGGAAFFWLLWKALGPPGFAAAQAIAYALFFLAALRLHRAAIPEAPDSERVAVGALAAFTPIMAHVGTNHWLDGPLLAVATLGSALFLEAARAGSARRAALAGLVLGAASWIKVPALLVLPGLAFLAWAANPRPASGSAWLRPAAIATAVAALVQAPWELWQWAALGSPLQAGAGRPVAPLVESNSFVHLVTAERPPWVYLTLLPIVVWSLVPAAAVLLFFRPDPARRRTAIALLGWIAVVVAPHVALGAMGWPKLLRFVILVTPATLLLVAHALRHLGAARGERGRAAGRPALAAATALVAAGIAFECLQGVVTTLVDRHDVILSLWR